jgi:hypothetical protein
VLVVYEDGDWTVCAHQYGLVYSIIHARQIMEFPLIMYVLVHRKLSLSRGCRSADVGDIRGDAIACKRSLELHPVLLLQSSNLVHVDGVEAVRVLPFVRRELLVTDGFQTYGGIADTD